MARGRSAPKAKTKGTTGAKPKAQPKYAVKNGQLTVRTKGGGRSWLGAPTATQTGDQVVNDGTGVMPVRLVPLGRSGGNMQYGYVPTGAEGTAGSRYGGGIGTGYLGAGGGRAGRVDSRTAEGGWKPRKGLSQEYAAMQAAITGKKVAAGKGPKGKQGIHGKLGNRRRKAGQFGVLGGAATEMGGIGAETAPFVPYAEADVSTTSYRRAQGKAYGRGSGEYLAGQTSSPPEGTSAVTGETSEEAGGSKRKKKKVVTRKKNKKGNTVVRTRKRPGGKVVSKRVVRKGR